MTYYCMLTGRTDGHAVGVVDAAGVNVVLVEVLDDRKQLFASRFFLGTEDDVVGRTDFQDPDHLLD